MILFYFKKSRITPLLLFICLSFSAIAQTDVRELLIKVKARRVNNNYPTDTVTINLLNAIADEYVYDSPDSALYFAKLALQIAKKLPRPSIPEAQAANNIAKIYYVKGYYFPSLDASDEAFAISKKINYKGGIASCDNIKGLIYLAQDNFDDALAEFDKALKLNGELRDSIKMAANYFDLGLTYDERHVFDRAFLHLNKAMEVSLKTKNLHIYLMTLNRLAETYYDSKNYDKALQFYKRALDFKLYHDNWESSFAYSGLGQTYQATGQYQKAIAYAQKSLSYSSKMKASWDAERALEILAASSASSGDYKDAYHYEGTLKAYADTLLNEAKEREINYLHLKEKRAENAELIKENQLNRQAIKINLLIISTVSLVAVFLAILIFIVSRNIGQKNRLNKELQNKNTDIAVQKEEILSQKEALIELNQTKDQVFSVISHDLRSPFAAIQLSLELLRAGDLDKNEFGEVFESFQQEVGLISQMINNLLNWANSQQGGIRTTFEKIDLADAVDDIVSISSIMAINKSQTLVHKKLNNPIWITADLNHVKIIIHNLIGNAIKFTPEGGNIIIFYTEEDSLYAIHIRDTGVGISPEKMEKLFKVIGKSISDYGTNKEPGTGIGLMLIKQFTEENGGHMEVRSEVGRGSEFIVYFKKAA